MNDNKIIEENGYKYSREKTEETPYYYETEYQGKLWCDYKTFRILHSIDEAEYKVKDEESRCVVLNKNGLPVKCRLNCSKECPFGLNHQRTGNPLSIEAIKEGNPNIDFIDYDSNPESIYSFNELKEAFLKDLEKLNSRDRLIYTSIKFEDKTESEVAQMLKISQPTVHKRMMKIDNAIKENLKKFIN